MDLRIEAAAARFHLPPRSAAVEQRLTRILEDALGEPLDLLLEDALARRGLPTDGELCLREVAVPARLRLGATDAAVALAWSDALAEAIATAAGAGDGCIHYRSRRDALADFARGVARGDLGRAWAWRQLGLAPSALSAATAPRALAQALAREPAALAPLLASLGDDLLPLARRFEPGWWSELAARALAAAGLPTPPDLGVEPAAHGGATTEPIAEPIRRRTAAALARSPLARLPRALPALAEPEPARALAALALLDADPGLLRASLGGLDLARLSGPHPLDPPLPTAREGHLPGEGDALAHPAAPKDRDSRPGARAAGRAEIQDQTDPGGEGRDAFEDGPPSGLDLFGIDGATGRTAWGGLLFLLGLAGEIGLPDAITDDPRLAERPFRGCLHALALALLPLDDDDPAALAFAGLPPGSEPPSATEPEWSDEERQAIADHAERLLAALAARLGLTPSVPLSNPACEATRPQEGDAPAQVPQGEATAAPGRHDVPPLPEGGPLGGRERGPGGQGQILRALARRRARIVADPGWFEVRLSLDEVATAVRRARLDLDPGYLPWLGVVVRFVYA